MYIFADLTITLVAWWGAVVATLVLLWDIYKWRTTGPKIVLTVLGDRVVLGDPELEGKTLITVEAANVGDRATTIQNLFFVEYKTLWQRFRKKRGVNYWIKNSGRYDPLPKKLEVGETWTGFAHQGEKETKAARNSYLYAQLFCSFRKLPVIKRVRISRPESEEQKK